MPARQLRFGHSPERFEFQNQERDAAIASQVILIQQDKGLRAAQKEHEAVAISEQAYRVRQKTEVGHRAQGAQEAKEQSRLPDQKPRKSVVRGLTVERSRELNSHLSRRVLRNKSRDARPVGNGATSDRRVACRRVLPRVRSGLWAMAVTRSDRRGGPVYDF